VLAQISLPEPGETPALLGPIILGSGVLASVILFLLFFKRLFGKPSGPPPIPLAEETVKPLSIEPDPTAVAASADTPAAAPQPAAPVPVAAAPRPAARPIQPAPEPPKPAEDFRPRAGREARTIGPSNLPPPPPPEHRSTLGSRSLTPEMGPAPVSPSARAAGIGSGDMSTPPGPRRTPPPSRPPARATAAGTGDEISLPDVRRKDLPPPRKVQSKLDPDASFEIIDPSEPFPPPPVVEDAPPPAKAAASWDPYAEVPEEFADAPSPAAPAPAPAAAPAASGAQRTGFDGKEWGSLALVSGADEGSSFALHGDEILIGRRVEGEHNLLLHDQFVSRVHGAIRRSMGTVTYTDMGSRGGSLVNDVTAAADTPVPLKPQDTIYVGETALRIEWKVTGLEAWELPPDEDF
jgi:hypothetical protein